MATKAVSAKTTVDWVAKADKLIGRFVTQHKLVLNRTERELSAAFEVGCFHALLRFYEAQHYSLTPVNLRDGAFRYLTTPSGNPENFSHIQARSKDGIEYEIRQQVRIQSHVDGDILFTPDMVVLKKEAQILGIKTDDFAGGKRKFFSVTSKFVVAAHECKSMNPFPELLVSFVGMLVVAHDWWDDTTRYQITNSDGHLAPTLFVGGESSALHGKMIAALQKSFHINIVTGMHRGSWNLDHARNRLVLTESLSPSSRSADISTTLLEDSIPF